MIRDLEVIKLNNKEYTVVASAKLNKNNYAFIINNENYNDVLFVQTNINEVEIIEEKKILGMLIPLFNEKLSEI